jgi:ElaB/YqjD/DUF883 family membrane-anchored ribosome-binding protein
MSDATQPQPESPKVPPQAEEESDPLRDLQERLAPQLEQAQAQLMEVNERVKDFIKKNPGSTLLGAAAIGFLVGKWASRR